MLYRIFRFLFKLLFVGIYRLEVIGRENVPAHGPVVLCANHTSNLDPPLVGVPLKRKVHYMAKEELFRVPVLGWLISRFGAFPVKRGGVSKESIRLAIQLLKENRMMGIFPEGSRSNAGGMGKKGAAMLALRSNATVIPVAIVGEYIPFRKMTIIYGKPVDLSEFAGGGSESLEAATDKIMNTIRQMVTTHKIMGKN
ncbi:lysophospholipid acyltransferase family protein [Paenibacillus aurantius]|uniref:Lysophospholipid acyltransferase family protein n=1 Tax=Paenibacillus aurantius TaxID=2918900 RepID=A0AA96L944_9BACL|nr:lysophospholipid acyltransferase family protein [Paenibacillus aurantius]WJH34218.1 1-acyl-sn-glycerol-3-phosphate acyltransferase [Paenibacillus sp. CC-CFT747]WNQ09306.1 lysophospholipid acyltransferase family protein [Paenibacillus aurantius]